MCSAQGVLLKVELSRLAHMSTVHNLRTVAAIVGRYTSVGTELTVGAGAEVGRFRNANGVTLELAGLQVGLAVGFGSAGMTILWRRCAPRRG